MNRTNRILTLLAMSLLVVGGMAAPVLADEDDDDDRRGSDRGPSDRSGSRDSDLREDRSGSRDGHHVAERCREAYNETGEVPEACRRAAALRDAALRCREAAQNGTDDLPDVCKRIHDAQDGEHKARRAAHAILKAIDALEHRVVRLEAKEVSLMGELESGNLTEENATKVQQHIDRIQDLQNHTLEQIAHLEARLDAIKGRWDAARDHVEAVRAREHDDDEDDSDESELEDDDSDDDDEDESDDDDDSEPEEGDDDGAENGTA